MFILFLSCLVSSHLRIQYEIDPFHTVDCHSNRLGYSSREAYRYEGIKPLSFLSFSYTA